MDTAGVLFLPYLYIIEKNCRLLTRQAGSNSSSKKNKNFFKGKGDVTIEHYKMIIIFYILSQN
ncbi:hypothetical protein A4D02_00125 [Niastella koreensis]|uniref:Uncharacterized protein n=1 Tax=Niastella koreensis TaxID=354356 RepID=A0ABX3P4Z0_9BACT|nr:hypothetical protein A4D02_00125 [Niastella koreensis]